MFGLKRIEKKIDLMLDERIERAVDHAFIEYLMEPEPDEKDKQNIRHKVRLSLIKGDKE